jgi:hypothetical protein
VINSFQSKTTCIDSTLFLSSLFFSKLSQSISHGLSWVYFLRPQKSTVRIMMIFKNKYCFFWCYVERSVSFDRSRVSKAEREAKRRSYYPSNHVTQVWKKIWQQITKQINNIGVFRWKLTIRHDPACGSRVMFIYLSAYPILSRQQKNKTKQKKWIIIIIIQSEYVVSSHIGASFKRKKKTMCGPSTSFRKNNSLL